MLQVSILGQRHKLFYGWIIVAGGFVNQLLNAGLGFQGFGVYLLPLQREFGWSKTQVAAARSFMQIENGLLGPIEGFLVDRFGPRLVMLLGLFVFGLGLVMFSQVHALWQYYLVFLVVALGSGLGGFLVMIVTINHWFRRKRTLAMSIAMLGLGFGGILVIPLLVWALESFGWRTAAFGSGLAVWAIGLPASLLMRTSPEKYAMGPDGDPLGLPIRTDPDLATARVNMGRNDFTLGEAVRTRAFWLLGIAHGLAIMVISAVSVHQFAHMEQGLGISSQSASLVVAVLSATNMPGRLVGGFLGDRLNKRYLAAGGVVGIAISLAIFALADSLTIGILYAVLYGFFWGMRAPLIDSLRGDYFGRAHFGKISGTSSLLLMPGSVFSPVFAGFMADTLGSYRLGFLVLAGLSCFGSILLLLAKPPTLPERLRIQASR